jgi:MFS family permease
MLASHSDPSFDHRSSSSLEPLRNRVFAVIWTATVISNVGSWMQGAAGGWLMISLSPTPRLVAMVQVVSALPMFLIGLPAGALADILDRRRLLLAAEFVSTILTLVFAGWIVWGHLTPVTLLGFIFLSSVVAALVTPSWQAIVPQLVSREDLGKAVALNSVGINISRAVGPALAGIAISYWGLSSPSWINAVSNIAVILALWWWRTRPTAAKPLPSERFTTAIIAGLRHTRYNAQLRATLVRAMGFFFFASAYWALLPIIARDRIAGGPQTYGLLLGAIGIGALSGAFFLPTLKAKLGPNQTMALGSIGTAVAILGFGIARRPGWAYLASFIAGLSWISVLSTLNVSAQLALPGWVRGRGLATYATTMFGSLTLGSLVWGEVGSRTGILETNLIAAVGAIAAAVLLSGWKLQAEPVLDLAPSGYWPEPVILDQVDGDRGPVLVSVDYRVRVEDQQEFLQEIYRLAVTRKRNGAYEWGVFEDVSQEGCWRETFLVDSWLEHLRQHDRVTNSDRDVGQSVSRFHQGGAPSVGHFVAPPRRPMGALPKKKNV